ncbi:hypothetical protein M413DRAFT_448278 [Hebeloma cylindrosporum]|uniref:Uncharacterized protein n=1 Tax=Hebeloma cylindrosporum TaxID=76867 RepID=A0A0C3C0F9_HEBCY|nr:hypothetical protein M413DRAFT_448278 [Hebeloma cylindrosporum h7]
MAPSIVKFIPVDPTTRPISQEDIENWRIQPKELVGKYFLSTELLRRVFLVDDYSVSQRKGAQYDVLYEDTGLDETLTIKPETLLEMVAEAELVTNALPRH